MKLLPIKLVFCIGMIFVFVAESLYASISGASGVAPSLQTDFAGLSSNQLCEHARNFLQPQKEGVRDRNAAIACLRLAVEKNDPQAKSMLGRVLMDFCYNSYAPEEGIVLLQAAKQAGVHDNDFILDLALTPPTKFGAAGTYIHFAPCISRSLSARDSIYLPEKSQKNKPAIYYGDELGMLYDYAAIRTLSQDKLKKLADGGNMSAGILWAYRVTQLLKSEAEHTETAKAVQFLKKASAQGYELADLVLASHIGIHLNMAKKTDEEQTVALEQRCSYYLKAAHAGVQEAAAHALNSAVRLSLLTGNPPAIPDTVLQEGINYLKERAKAKYDGSCITLGEMYLWGFYVPSDEQEGVRWLEMRALAGDAVACTALVNYFSGQFAPPGKQARVEDASKARYYSELMSGINSFFPY